MTAVRRRLHPLPPRPGQGDELDPVGPTAPPSSNLETPDQMAGPATVAVKRRDEVDAELLEREAEVLRALAGGPVVELVDVLTDCGQVELRTRSAGSATLADVDGLPTRNVLRACAAACRSVVELHRSGWGHGALAPDHFVVGGRGRTTLCSLGHAQPLVAAPELVTVDRAATMATIAAVADHLERSTERPVRRAALLLRKSVGPAHDDLLDVAARIEGGLQERPGKTLPGHRVLVPAAVVAAVALLAGAWTWTSGSRPSARRSLPSTSVRVEGRRGPRSATVPAGQLRVGAPGDQSVVVDLDCDGDDEVVLLRPSTGELFVAPRLPHDEHNVRAVPAGHLDGATGLTTTTASDGCALPLATMPDGTTEPVDVRPAPAEPTAPEGPPPTTVLPTADPPAGLSESGVGPPTTARESAPAGTPARPRAAPVTTAPSRPAPRQGPRPSPAAPPTTNDPPYELPVTDVPGPTTDPPLDTTEAPS